MKDLKKIQEFFSKPLEEANLNDPVLMKMRAAKDKLAKMRAANAGDDGNDKFFDNAKKIAFLKKERAQLMRDMEQEAEPEGGPIADEYGSKLNRIDKAIVKLSGRKEMTYDQAIEENQTESKYKKGDKITYYGNKGVVNSAKWNSMAKDWEYYVTYYKDDVRRSDNGINDRELKPLEENTLSPEDFPSNFKQGDTVYVFDRIKGDRAMYYNPMIKGDRVVFKSRKEMDSLLDESVVTEVKVGDKVKINKEYGGGKGTIEDIVGSFVVVNGKSYHESDVEKVDLDEEKGYSPQLVTPENPKGETKGLTPDVMNKILMKVIQDLDESSNKINKA